MRRYSTVLTVLVSVLALGVFGMLARGQAEGGDGNAGGGRPRFDPQQMRQRMMERMKEQLGATDEEWKALEPRVEKVMTASREARFGGMGAMMGGRRGGPGGAGGGPGPADNQPQSAVGKATADLRSGLDDKNTSADEIAKRLTALREARAKAKQDFEAAAKELKEVLTQRQEATMVMMGILE